MGGRRGATMYKQTAPLKGTQTSFSKGNAVLKVKYPAGNESLGRGSQGCQTRTIRDFQGLLGVLRAYWEDLAPLAYLDSQVAGNSRPLYPKVDHYWFKVAHNYEPRALQVRSNGLYENLPGPFRP